MDERKHEQATQAAHSRKLKQAQEINSLAIAALRAASMLAVLKDLLHESGAGTSEFGDQHLRALAGLEVNSASRASAQMTFFYAALNVVVEGWRELGTGPHNIADPDVDALLAKGHLVDALARYRNSMLHPNLLNEKRQLQFAAIHGELSEWAQKLCEAFLRYFRSWRSSIAADR
jgi:hypothetical protein